MVLFYGTLWSWSLTALVRHAWLSLICKWFVHGYSTISTRSDVRPGQWAYQTLYIYYSSTYIKAIHILQLNESKSARHLELIRIYIIECSAFLNSISKSIVKNCQHKFPKIANISQATVDIERKNMHRGINVTTIKLIPWNQKV